jgi:RNA polymerase sigma factor (sigma-70 family)
VCPAGGDAKKGLGEIGLSADDLATAFDDFARPLLNYLRRQVTNCADAEDLLSVVYLEAWRTRSGAFMVDGTLAAWLYGIARNVLRGQRRASRRHRAALNRYAATHGAGESNQNEYDDVVSRVDAAKRAAAITAALAQLSQKDRSVADICLVEELSTSQAAAILDLPVGTVKSRLAHARAALRPILQTSDSPLRGDPEPGNGHVVSGSAPRSERRVTT